MKIPTAADAEELNLHFPLFTSCLEMSLSRRLGGNVCRVLEQKVLIFGLISLFFFVLYVCLINVFSFLIVFFF